MSVGLAAEAAGFDVISFSDRPPEPSMEGWTLATAVAVQTERIAVTHSTLNVPFRNPALLAKMASTLDVMTGGGRVILTLGAGGQETHYRTYGIEFGSPGERVTDLEDAIAIMRGLWANESFSYAGRQFSVEECSAPPAPLGPIPIIIGAGGPRMLRYTGAHAEGLDQERRLAGEPRAVPGPARPDRGGRRGCGPRPGHAYTASSTAPATLATRTRTPSCRRPSGGAAG